MTARQLKYIYTHHEMEARVCMDDLSYTHTHTHTYARTHAHTLPVPDLPTPGGTI